MATATATTTESVLGQHVQALVSRNLDSIMADFSDDAVLFSPNGAFKGTENIRAFFTAALEMLAPESMANLTVIKQDIDGEYAYVLWSASPAVSFAGDTFCVHDGKIVLQSFVTQMGS
ncbi:MAG: nuclear transport factor 2 family protein [Burkholderiales bacterium]|nr:nuclear transport factor 2 family protein [Anaerolineae bacterium]